VRPSSRYASQLSPDAPGGFDGRDRLGHGRSGRSRRADRDHHGHGFVLGLRGDQLRHGTAESGEQAEGERSDQSVDEEDDEGLRAVGSVAALGSVMALIARTSSPRDPPAPSKPDRPRGPDPLPVRCAWVRAALSCSETPWRQSSVRVGDPATPRSGALSGWRGALKRPGRDRQRRTMTPAAASSRWPGRRSPAPPASRLGQDRGKSRTGNRPDRCRRVPGLRTRNRKQAARGDGPRAPPIYDQLITPGLEASGPDV
jgi:hypothetical protein